MATVYDKKVCPPRATRPGCCALARGVVLGVALALSACASTAPRVPPPPGFGPVTSSPVARGSAVATVEAAPQPGFNPAPGQPLPPKLKFIDYPPGAEPVLNPAPVRPAAPVLRPIAPPEAMPPAVAAAPLPQPPSRWVEPPVATAPVASDRIARWQPMPPPAAPAAPAPAWQAPAVAPLSRPVDEAPRFTPAALPSLAAPAPRVAPRAAASGSGGFVIGPGDTVQIDVLGRPELSAKGNVAADGRVTVALVGAVNIGGLTPVQAADRIAAAYREGQYLVSPQVTVTLEDFQSQTLTVLGEVRNPGRFAMRTQLSVLDGLALAGGTTEQGASTAYLLRPDSGVVSRYEIDLEALIQAGAGQQYFEALPGDTLVVPRTAVFYIYGEAKNPNSYKLKPGMTVIQALSLAGGLTDKGSDKRIDIRRRDASGQLQTLAVSLNEPLQADDVVYVRERLF